MIGDGMDLTGRVVSVVLGVLTLAMLITFARLVRGPTLADRVVALELTASLAIGVIAAYDIATEQPVFLDIASVLALLGFLAAVAFSRYIETRRIP